jgi:hypothetical protein
MIIGKNKTTSHQLSTRYSHVNMLPSALRRHGYYAVSQLLVRNGWDLHKVAYRCSLWLDRTTLLAQFQASTILTRKSPGSTPG